MGRAEFVGFFGSLQDIVDRKESGDAAEPSKAAANTAIDKHEHFQDIPFDDLDVIRTLGCGAFGRVRLVKSKSKGGVYALKALKKIEIVNANLQAHVLQERNVML